MTVKIARNWFQITKSFCCWRKPLGHLKPPPEADQVVFKFPFQRPVISFWSLLTSLGPPWETFGPPNFQFRTFFWLMEAILATNSRPIVNMCLDGIREAYTILLANLADKSNYLFNLCNEQCGSQISIYVFRRDTNCATHSEEIGATMGAKTGSLKCLMS